MSSNKISGTPIEIKTDQFDFTDCLVPLFRDLIREHKFLAGIICFKKIDQRSFEVLLGDTIPISPLNGNKNQLLNDFIDGCYSKYPAPHIHSAKDSDFWKGLSSFCRTSEWVKKIIFIPFQAEDYQFSILYFGDANELRKLKKESVDSSELIVQSAVSFLNYENISNNIQVMECYVKEVGHDISSSVQAIISKIRNVRRGLVTGALAEKKLEEAESEILATHRIADTLGIAVDPDYNIRSGNDFNICDVVQSVINLCSSEAEERHSRLLTDMPDYPVMLWGDNKAIESATTQYVINAIKYCHGGSDISVSVIGKDRYVEVKVVNVGIPLGDDIEQRMWGFGERGRRALEYHVNGSGIGLYTVNKIIAAHNGEVYFRRDRQNTGLAIFGFIIPKNDILKKEKLL